MSIPYNERKWIDVERGILNQGCIGVSTLMIRLPRRDESVHREEDGAVRFDDLASIFRSEFDGTALVNSSLDKLLSKKEEDKRKGFSTMRPETNSNDFGGFGND